MAGLKTLAKELQSKGRNGDTILAHINPQEASLLKTLGGSGTINPITGLPEYWGGLGALNPFNPGSGLNKTLDTTPVIGDIKRVTDKVGTQIFQPLEKAIVQPVSKGLSEFDKQVARTIPGGWGTVAQVAASMVPGGQPLAVGIGAARGAGLLRTGSSLQRANLQGALIGGATAYATSELGEYMRGASDTAAAGAPGAMSSADVIAQEGGSLIIPEATGSAVSSGGVNAATGELGSGLAGNASGYLGSEIPVSDVLSNVSGYDVGAPLPAPQSIGSEIMKGNISNVASRGIANLENLGTSTVEGIQNLGTQAVELGNKAITPETYTEGIPNLLTKGSEGAGDTLSGAKNLLGAGEMTAKEAAKLAAKTGVDPIKMAALGIYGETTLAGMEEQRKYLEEAKRANAISQAEYDRAMASIISQRDYAADVVSRNQFNPNPSRDVSIGETFYGRSGEGENLYGRAPDSGSMLYAMGGSVDDELGGDYSAMGMDQGNLQKGLFGMGYAAGGQIDMGNGYNPFANLPPMSGPLGAINSNFDPTSGFDTSVDMNIGRLASLADQYGAQSNNGLMSMFKPSAQQNTPQMSPSLDQNPNTNIGGFASPSSFYGGGGSSGIGGGGNGGAFPLEGQYGIVKMAAGGMPPRFLSGGGDGMSDSIPATINDKQPARLADGEFVIPADVVSHIGNGSSKAGAKQLYSMMDKVRKARTGNSKQGKQINPRKYLPA